jgi:hypothetical protein
MRKRDRKKNIYPAAAWMPVSCECCYCQVTVTASGWSLVQRSPTECGVSEYDREASTMRRSWPTRVCCAMGKKMLTDRVASWLAKETGVGMDDRGKRVRLLTGSKIFFSTAFRQAQWVTRPSIRTAPGPLSQVIMRPGSETDSCSSACLHNSALNSSLGQVNLFTF